MALINSTYIGDWDAVNGGNDPVGGDSRRDGDDNMRAIQGTVKRTFPGFQGTTASPKTVNASEDEINRLVGISQTDPIITLPAGTKAIFYQDAAPTGWAIDETIDEHSVRLTKGTTASVPGQQGGVSGGSYDFSATFTDLAANGAPGVQNHTLTGAQSGTSAHPHPAHGHQILTSWTGGTGQTRNRVSITAQTGTGNTPIYTNSDVLTLGNPYVQASGINNSTEAVASEGHAHGLDLKVKWAACIVATKQ